MTSDIFSKRLREIRQLRNLTQNELSKKLNISRQSLSAYENNQKQPPAHLVGQIANILDVSIDWLYGISNVMERNASSPSDQELFQVIQRLADNPSKNISCALNISKPDSILIKIEIDKNSLLYPVLRDFSKYHTMHREHTIDDTLYNLWIKDRLDDLSPE